MPVLHIYNPDGSFETYHPANGVKWTLAELEFLICGEDQFDDRMEQ